MSLVGGADSLLDTRGRVAGETVTACKATVPLHILQITVMFHCRCHDATEN
jgi:hypothetical protein